MLIDKLETPFCITQPPISESVQYVLSGLEYSDAIIPHLDSYPSFLMMFAMLYPNSLLNS